MATSKCLPQIASLVSVHHPPHCRYSGEWTNGKINGKGIATKGADLTPTVFTSYLSNVLCAGTIYLASGDKYTGDWKEGRRHGTGTYFYRFSAVVQHFNSQMCDVVCVRFTATVIDTTGSGATTSGCVSIVRSSAVPLCFNGPDAVFSSQHGRGVMTYSSDGGGSAVQERYEGEWVDGKMQGRGTYQYSDGSVFDGGWVAGKMQGKGVFVYPNGNRYEGEFYVRFLLASLLL